VVLIILVVDAILIVHLLLTHLDVVDATAVVQCLTVVVVDAVDLVLQTGLLLS
jgi:hypothetical protein